MSNAMSDGLNRPLPFPALVLDKICLGMPVKTYAKSLLTKTNAIYAVILAIGLPTLAYRYWKGMGAVSNLSQTNPWGIWVGINIICGIALAAGGYTVAATVYIFGLEQYRPILRPAILTGFLGYVCAISGLIVELGQPWRLPYQLFLTPGTTAVMFEVGMCAFAYLIVLGLEMLPAGLEWLGLARARRVMGTLTIGIVVLGITLSTLHQASLGAFFLMVPGKLHPLWYSPYLPVFFFISSISAGIGMIIFESSVSRRAFRDELDPEAPVDLDALQLGLAKGGAVVLFATFFIRLQGLVASGRWDLLFTGWGAWFALELVGFILLPSLLYAFAVRTKSVTLTRAAAVMAVLGVVLNRVNVSLVAYNWNVPASDRYVPSMGEIVLTILLITCGVLAFRWIVNRMPVLREHPEWRGSH
jgi:Ni/Fe-hydrogenase subunit HybB-like protein